jgi:hypothetical protein
VFENFAYEKLRLTTKHILGGKHEIFAAERTQFQPFVRSSIPKTQQMVTLAPGPFRGSARENEPKPLYWCRFQLGAKIIQEPWHFEDTLVERVDQKEESSGPLNPILPERVVEHLPVEYRIAWNVTEIYGQELIIRWLSIEQRVFEALHFC